MRSREAALGAARNRESTAQSPPAEAQAAAQQPPAAAQNGAAVAPSITLAYETGWHHVYLHHSLDGKGPSALMAGKCFGNHVALSTVHLARMSHVGL